jgi:hypothetical protein
VAYDETTMRKRQTESDALVEAQQQLDALIKKEAADREAELQRTLAVARAETSALLTAEHRRLAEARRDELVRAEQRVLTELSGRLIAAQKEIEAKLAAWSQDMERVREGLATQVARIEQRQKQLFADAEARFTSETERLVSDTEDHRAALARVREEMAKQIKDAIEEGTSELETHSAERRRALHEVADRLRTRERKLTEQIDRELTESTRKLTETFADVDRRLIDQVERSVAREAGRLTEAAAVEFNSMIHGAREEAGRRLQRELDRAIETFGRHAEKLLAERLVEFGDTAGGKLERRYEGTIATLERRVAQLERALQQREEALTND